MPTPRDMPQKVKDLFEPPEDECVIEIAHHRDFYGTPTGSVKIRTNNRPGVQVTAPYGTFADFLDAVKEGVYDEYYSTPIGD